MLARAHAFDTVVVALIGERGREVREFLEDTIGAEGMKKRWPSSPPATRAP
jgi:flagellum-specific ATP synthase